MTEEDVKKYWLEMYREDKIGTIAKLSQAMQHMAWLREWKRVNGNKPRIKPITQKVNGEKVKVGESDIAVSWSELDKFFRTGNEYGDIETVKFLAERIESGDVSELTEQELHDLSERENVKWSDGKHSLNPFQGYLYDVTPELEVEEEKYGKFYPIRDYEDFGSPQDVETSDERSNETHKAFNRYYTTRLIQKLLRIQGIDSKYYDFANFDITSVTTLEQIEELDKKLTEIIQSTEVQAQLEVIKGNEEYEKLFYDELRQEIDIEIKKDSDRIKNAHKVFVALETGNLDEILEDPETQKLATNAYEEEIRIKTEKEAEIQRKEEEKQGKEYSEKFKKLVEYIIKSEDPRLDQLCLVDTYEYESGDESSGSSNSYYTSISIREAMLSELTDQPMQMEEFKFVGYHHGKGFHRKIILDKDFTVEQKMLSNIETKKRQEKATNVSEKRNTSKRDKVGTAVFSNKRGVQPWMIECIPELEDYQLHGSLPENISIEPATIEVTKRELEEKGLGNVEWTPSVTKKRGLFGAGKIAEVDRESEVTTTEVGGVKGFLAQLLDKCIGKGEK